MPEAPLASRRLLRFACALLVAVTAFLAVLVPAQAEQATADIARAALTDARGDAGLLRVSVALGDVTEQTDAAVRAVLAEALAEARLDAAVHAVLTSAPTRVDGGMLSTLIAVPDDADRPPLREGVWPAALDEVALSADVADASGLRPGDTTSIGAASARVVGVFAGGADTVPSWMRPPAGLATAEQPRGTVAVAVERLRAQDGGTARWVMVPEADGVSLSALRRLPGAWREVARAVRQQDIPDADLSGGLVPTALAAVGRADATSATAPVAFGVAAVIAAISTVAFAQLLLSAAAPRRALLWARGASRARLVGDAVAPVVPFSAAGAALGALAASAVAIAVGAPVSPGGVLAAALAVAAVFAALGAAAALADAIGRDRAGAPGWTRRVVAAAVVALVVAAALAASQLLLYGSVTATDGGGADPVVSAAPVLTLLAVVAVLVAAVAALRRPVYARAVRSSALRPLLVSSALRRRGAVVAIPVVVSAIAIAQLVLAGGFGATWVRQYDADQLARWGTPVQVSAPGGLSDETIAALARAPQVAAVAPVTIGSVAIASQSVVVEMLAPDALALAAVDDEVRAAYAAAIAAPVDAPALDGLAVRVDGPGAAQVTRTRALLLDELGCLVRTPWESGAGLAAVRRDEACGADARMIGVEFETVAAADAAAGATLAVAVTRDGVAADVSRWATATGMPDAPMLGDEGIVRVPSEPGVLRIIAPAPLQPWGALISARMAELGGLVPGDSVRVTLADPLRQDTLRIAAVVDAVPGAATPTAVLLDGRAVTIGALRAGEDPPPPTQAWVVPADADPGSIGGVLAGIVGADASVGGTEVAARPEVRDAAPRLLWTGALTSLALALVTVAAVLSARRGMLAPERAALRAAGVARRRVGGADAREMAWVLGAGLVVGAAAGASATLLLAPALVRGATTGLAGAVAPAIDLLPVASALGAFTALTAALAVLSARIPSDGASA